MTGKQSFFHRWGRVEHGDPCACDKTEGGALIVGDNCQGIEHIYQSSPIVLGEDLEAPDPFAIPVGRAPTDPDAGAKIKAFLESHQRETRPAIIFDSELELEKLGTLDRLHTILLRALDSASQVAAAARGIDACNGRDDAQHAAGCRIGDLHTATAELSRALAFMFKEPSGALNLDRRSPVRDALTKLQLALHDMANLTVPS